jgi:hypothetical protein
MYISGPSTISLALSQPILYLVVPSSQGVHKNRETESRIEVETELTEISVFSINRYFFGFHLY